MNREVHVRFWEGLAVKFCWATQLYGYVSLVFDVVRRVAPPVGIHLEDWEGRIIETEKGLVMQ